MSTVHEFPKAHDNETDRDRNTAELVQHTRFDEFYGEWLINRGRGYAPEPETTLEDELVADARRDELVLLIAATPVSRPDYIARKVEVLNHCLEAAERPADAERPELLLVASIKADLLRLAAS